MVPVFQADCARKAETEDAHRAQPIRDCPVSEYQPESALRAWEGDDARRRASRRRRQIFLTHNRYLQHTSFMDPARFAALASRVARGVSRLEREEICCGDLTLQQFETLRALRDDGPLTLGGAAKRLGIDLSTASRNLARLVTNGYLVRRRGREDAREVRFALSKKGAACLDSLACDERAVFASLLARIPAERRALVGEALELIAAALDAEPPTTPAACCCPPRKPDAPNENAR